MSNKVISFNPTHKLILCTGVVPSPENQRSAEFWDRLKNVNFPFKYQPETDLLSSIPQRRFVVCSGENAGKIETIDAEAIKRLAGGDR